MHRSLKLSVLLALALGTSQAAAMQLGQIQVKSALGQPLLAEIPLTPDSPGEMKDLSVRLASPEDFARAGLGVSRPSIPLQFTVTGSGSHRVIRVTSSVPVNDPYLDLLVEVDTASGRSLREFPVLLDPPGGAPVANLRAPVAGKAATRQPARATGAAAAAPAATTAGSAGQGGGQGQYGPVKPGQTLSGIAHDVAPAGVDPNQMLMALKDANPDAFYRDNINALKSGAVLRVPSAEQARAMSAAAAMAAVRRQNSDWTHQAANAPTVVADAGTRSGANTSPTGGAGGDRLALVPAKQGGKSAGTSGGSAKGDAALRQDLLRSQESLTTLRQQSADLKSRLKDLQDLNDKNQRLLALKDNEIAELQQKLAAARKSGAPAAAASSMAAAPAAAATATTAATPAAATSAAPAAATSAASMAGPAKAGSTVTAHASPAASASTAVVSPAGKATRPASKPSARTAPAPVAEQPWFMQPWVWEAAGGAVVLLLLLALVARRRKAPAAAKPASSLADRFGALHDEPVTGADPEQDELLDQLAEHPDDIGLHLELVGLYYTRRDVEHFEAAAEAMYAHVSDPEQSEWLDVVAMGEDLVPNHPLFGGQGGSDEAEPAFDEGDYGMPLDAEEDHAVRAALGEDAGEEAGFDLDSFAAGHEEDGPAAPRSKVSEYHFDFDLTPNARQAREAAAAHAGTTGEAPADADNLEGMDFDLTDSEDAGTPSDAPVMATEEPASTWEFDSAALDGELQEHTPEPAGESAGFSEDPIDTKLDLARAYLDMGDADGARGMLEEVLQEGSQMQKDAAQRLLDSLG